jgi:hypothetical protein
VKPSIKGGLDFPRRLRSLH